MTISQLCLPNIACHLPWELNSQCTLVQVGHILQCNVFTEQLRQSLTCFVRSLQCLMATNEEITSSVDKVSDHGIELKLDSFLYAVIVSGGGNKFCKKKKKSFQNALRLNPWLFKFSVSSNFSLFLITHLTEFKVWINKILLNLIGFHTFLVMHLVLGTLTFL